MEFRRERFEGTVLGGEDVSTDAIAAQLARWLRRLPGDTWNTLLPDPDDLP